MNLDVGIYRIKWNNCDYFYIGQSIELRNRKSRHLSQLSLGIHQNSKLQNVYNKYGNPIFEILDYCTEDKLTSYEQLYLDCYFDKKYCCNLTDMAESVRGYKHTEETINKVKESILLKRRSYFGSNNPRYGIKASETVRKNQSELAKRNNFGKDRGKKVINISNGKTFNSCKEAAEFYNISYGTLRGRLNGYYQNNTKLRYA